MQSASVSFQHLVIAFHFLCRSRLKFNYTQTANKIVWFVEKLHKNVISAVFKSEFNRRSKVPAAAGSRVPPDQETRPRPRARPPPRRGQVTPTPQKVIDMTKRFSCHFHSSAV